MTSAESTRPVPLSVSIVIPVYNSDGTLAELVRRLHTVLPTVANQFETILVNDGSRDRSWQAISDLVQEYRAVRGINLTHNFGQHQALLAGIQRARYEIIVTLDDDLQHPPEEIPRLLSKLSEGYDVVYGRPAERSHSVWRNTCSKVLKTLLKIVQGTDVGSHSSAFRAFRAILRRGFSNFADAQLSIDVLLSWGAARVTHIPVEHHARRLGRSGYSLSKLMLLAISMLVGYSTLPLRLASGMGLVASLIGVLVFLYVVIRRLLQTTYTPGFAFLASEIAIFAGMQLFAIGVIGEYMARLHFRTIGKPPYVIRQEIGSDVLSKRLARDRAADPPESMESC